MFIILSRANIFNILKQQLQKTYALFKHTFRKQEALSFEVVRSEEHTSELQSRVDIAYAVFCLKKNFFNDTATTEIYTLSLHDALPIYIL